jgi:adenosylcobinamide kinase / adenosylcobinamide-phosphate guanylyltransferase
MKILVTGGVRSGKSRHAESLLSAQAAVAYVAPGPVPDDDDADWAARVAAHRAARPPAWVTHETRDVAGVLERASGPVLVDCLGTWLTGVIDERELWESPSEEVAGVVDGLLSGLVDALAATPVDAVLVTNEVGLGVVPAHRSGRLFRDLLGTVNQRVAAACDEVHLVVAGRVLRL